MKILHTADIHLRQYKDARWNTLQKLIEIGKKEGIKVFVISGDLFNEGVDAENLRPKIRDTFSGNGFKVVLIPGNHDFNSYKPGTYFGEDTIILNNLNDPFEYEDIRIWGMPFEPIGGAKVISKLHTLATKLGPDKKNILLFHGELLDAFFSRRDFGEEGEDRYMPVKLSYFKNLNFHYVLAGHFHSRFDVSTFAKERYFVYPGSPISISKRETGKRKINVFRVGESPKEYVLNTPYFEEVIVEFDPYKDKKPIDTVKSSLKNIPPEAEIILTVKGYINCKELAMDETTVVEKLKEITSEKCVETHYEFRDVQTILEDDLFKRLSAKLEQADYEEEKKRHMREIAIKAMMESRS